MCLGQVYLPPLPALLVSSVKWGVRHLPPRTVGFPGGWEGKEFGWNVGDLGSIPGSGRSPGEENGNPLQYSGLENSVDRGAWRATVHKLQRVGHDWVTFTHTIRGLCWGLNKRRYERHPAQCLAQSGHPRGWAYITCYREAMNTHRPPPWHFPSEQPMIISPFFIVLHEVFSWEYSPSCSHFIHTQVLIK